MTVYAGSIWTTTHDDFELLCEQPEALSGAWTPGWGEVYFGSFATAQKVRNRLNG